jgi:DNA-binding transcriptional ArsR family regulator
MNVKFSSKYERKADVLKAIAHPTRLFIIDMLDKKEYCVMELTEMIGSDFSTVSKHLTVLKKAGLVADKKRGNCNYFRLLAPCILKMLNCTNAVSEKNYKKSLAAAKPSKKQKK